MKISIVTISYNQAQFLEKTILSVIKQDYENIEYIIVDAGSTDGSREIIRKYSNYFNHIILEPDSGPAEGLNKGFSMASGEIYGYLNSDDILLPGALKKVSTYFHKNSKVDVVSGNCFIIDTNDKILRKCFSDKFSKLMYAYIEATLIQPSTFFKKECFDKTNGFNINNHCCWDDELFVEMGINCSIFHNTNDFLSCFRLHSKSITSTKLLYDIKKQYNDRKFLRIMARKKNLIDILLKGFFKIIKNIKNPKNFYERLFKGKIYGKKFF